MKRRKTSAVGLLIGLVIGFGVGCGVIPKGPHWLTEEEVRRPITELPYRRLEVKPETIEFQSLELVRKDRVYVWVAEYECEARIIPGFALPPNYTLGPFVRMLIRTEMETTYSNSPLLSKVGK